MTIFPNSVLAGARGGTGTTDANGKAKIACSACMEWGPPTGPTGGRLPVTVSCRGVVTMSGYSSVDFETPATA